MRNESMLARFNTDLSLSSRTLGAVSSRSPVTIRDTEDVVPETRAGKKLESKKDKQ